MNMPREHADHGLGAYVVTAHPPSRVTHTAVGHFLSAEGTARNCVVAKVTRIEVYVIAREGCVCAQTLPVYGRVISMHLFRPDGAAQDDLFLVTAKHSLLVLRWNAATQQCDTIVVADVKDGLGSAAERDPIVVLDPKAKCAALYQYEHMVRLVPLTAACSTAFNVRLSDATVRDIVFLHGCRKPTIAVLSLSEEAHYVKTLQFAVSDQDVSDGPWAQVPVDGEAHRLIPVPAPFGGVLVLAEQSVSYVNDGKSHCTFQMEAALITAWCAVDADGSRFLLGDHLGRLMMLVLDLDAKKKRVQALALEVLGETSICSAMSYMDNSFVFIGSEAGDSQIVQLDATAVAGAGESRVKVVKSYQNLGPIVDFCMMKSGNNMLQGQGQMVTCSGRSKDGSLRIIRNGIGIAEVASIAETYNGIKELWSLRRQFGDRYHAYLALRFATETRVLELSADGLGETVLSNMDEKASTFFMGNMAGDIKVQVTDAGVRIVGAAVSCTTPFAWTPPSGAAILAAAGNASQILVAISGSKLCLLEALEGSSALVERKQIQLPNEISCLDCNPLGALKEDGSPENSAATVAAVGMWAGENEMPTVQLMALPSLSTICTVTLEDGVMARSVVMATLEGYNFLLIALGDGHLLSYKYGGESSMLSNTMEGVLMSDGDAQTLSLHDRRRLNVGTQPAALSLFRSRGSCHVFAACDRPTVVYAERGGKLRVSNVNLGQVNRVCAFDTEDSHDCLALAREGDLLLGNVDEIQKLHITTVPLNQQPRRVVHMHEARVLCVLSESTSLDENGYEVMNFFIRLFSDTTYEPLDEMKMPSDEQPSSLCVSSFSGDGIDEEISYLVVGSGYVPANEPESNSGRLILFSVSAENPKLVVVGECKTKGTPYTLKQFDGRLLAGVNALVQLYSVSLSDSDKFIITEDFSYHGNVLVVKLATRGDFVLVGDLMRSVTLLSKKSLGKPGLEQLGRDHDASWLTAMEILGDDSFIMSEMSTNMVTLRRDTEAVSDSERMNLKRVGKFHVGSLINSIQHGSLVMQMPDDDSPALKNMIFGTADGMVGVVATLKGDEFLFMEKVQSAVESTVQGIGGLSHCDWRAYTAEQPVLSQKSSGYIDGDLVESFLELPSAQAVSIAKIVGVSVEELTHRIEAMASVEPLCATLSFE